jgi:UrcA family protein
MTRTAEITLIARFAPALLIGSALLAGNAFAAQPAAALPSVTVKFEDLNLNSTSGVAALYRRIHAAAKNVCALPDGDTSNEVHALELKCVAETESRTIGRMRVESLSAYYDRKTASRSSVAEMAAARRP